MGAATVVDADTAPFFARLAGSAPAFISLHDRYRRIFDRSQEMRGLRGALISADVGKMVSNAARHALLMAKALPAYDDHSQFGSLTSYVEEIEMRASLTRGELKADQGRLDPYAMFGVPDSSLFAEAELIRDAYQLAAEHVHRTDDVDMLLNVVKQGRVYRLEQGEEKLTDRTEKTGSINIGTMNGGRLNIGSVDNSTNVEFAGKVFVDLRSKAQQIPDAGAREQILKRLSELEAQRSGSGFLEAYRRFMADAADHIGVFGPAIAALTTLLPR